MSPQWQLYAINRAVNDLNAATNSRNPGAKIKPDQKAPGKKPNGPQFLPGGNGTAQASNITQKRNTADENIPVEEWMQRTGELLEKKLERTVSVPKTAVKATVDIILNDLYRFASERVNTPTKPADTRSNIDRIQDLFNNYDNYQEAWDAAKVTAQKRLGNQPGVLEALDEWMGSALDYGGALSKELTNQSEIRIDQKLVERFLSAKNVVERDAVLGDIYQNVADQVPSTWMDKWNAWRYLSMLGTRWPSTQAAADGPFKGAGLGDWAVAPSGGLPGRARQLV